MLSHTVFLVFRAGDTMIVYLARCSNQEGCRYEAIPVFLIQQGAKLLQQNADHPHLHLHALRVREL